MSKVAGSNEYLKIARQCFQLVGSSASDCDTISGRQCMAACFYLLRRFEDANLYLSSVKPFMSNDHDFNYNHGMTLAAAHNCKDAEDALLLVQSECHEAEYVYISFLSSLLYHEWKLEVCLGAVLEDDVTT